MTNKVEIRTDVTDWADEFRRDEPTLDSRDDVVRLLRDGYKTGQIARMALAGRAMGAVSPGIMRTDKQLLHAAGCHEVSSIARQHTERVEMPSGREYDVPQLVGRTVAAPEDGENGGPPDDEPSYVDWHTARAIERAREYMLRAVPGHLFPRMKILAACKADVRGAWEEVKAIGDGMVARLLEPEG